VRVGSLFAGIGGFDLAARWMGWETVWFSEVDEYAAARLAEHFPGVPNHGDITQIDFAAVEPIDMLCGGFPCQDVSQAGPRVGIEGARSGLWTHYARAIRDLRPRYAVVENTPGLLHRGMGRVLGDLAELGYAAEWAVLSAGELGAPHLRERVWIVAYPEHQPDAPERGQRPTTSGQGARRGDGARGGRAPAQRQEPICGAWEVGGSLSEAARLIAGQLRRGERTAEGAGDGDVLRAWLQPEPCRVAHGLPAELDARHRCTGNAIVPACAYAWFLAIEEREQRLSQVA
jgi:hypothetical protein